MAEALDTETGSNVLTPLRRELFHGLGPFRLAVPLGPTAAGSITESAAPSPSARLQEVLTRLRDIRLMVERACAGTDVPPDVHTRARP
ncbi:hypothetical protein ACIPSJ_26955 [Streptomyces sp. NPDC090088]|uniref:hypothetical protein n=1 Tax=Streptomyces sp. NPDC090088 TaxID=3365944 RepID=UPI0037F87B78